MIPNPPPAIIVPALDLREVRAARQHWERVAGRLNDPAVELDCETFSEILEAYRRLCLSGATIDAGLQALMTCLTRQLIDTVADTDSDVCVTDRDEDDEVDRLEACILEIDGETSDDALEYQGPDEDLPINWNNVLPSCFESPPGSGDPRTSGYCSGM